MCLPVWNLAHTNPVSTEQDGQCIYFFDVHIIFGTCEVLIKGKKPPEISLK